MKLVKIDPPGTWCHNEAVLDLVSRSKANSFVEVGCGAADLSFKLCSMGMTGIGIDFSNQAIELAKEKMKPFIDQRKYQLIQADVTNYPARPDSVDIAISMMVMEHVEDDISFLKSLSKFVKPGGHVMVAVPGRKDRWCFEDETVGHLRRYDKKDLEKVMADAGLRQGFVWSVAVPVANLLFHISNYLVKRSKESEKKSISLVEQTKSSGIREIPFKTVFPSFFKIILNRVTLYPLFIIQRLFYNSGLGLTMLGMGKVDKTGSTTN